MQFSYGFSSHARSLIGGDLLMTFGLVLLILFLIIFSLGKGTKKPVAQRPPVPAKPPVANTPLASPPEPRQLSMMDWPESTEGRASPESMEGEDPCHQDTRPLANHVARPQRIAVSPTSSTESAPENSSLQLNWSGQEMVHAFIMQEVLTRPCDRKRRQP